jgi:hypothetical protein
MVTGSRMDREARRLVDDEEVIVFIDNPDRDGLRRDCGRSGRW